MKSTTPPRRLRRLRSSKASISDSYGGAITSMPADKVYSENNDGFGDFRRRRNRTSGEGRKPLVTAARRRLALRERPDAVGELEHQEAVILAGGPERSVVGVQMHLRRARIRSAGTPLTDGGMVRSHRCGRRPCRIEVGDLRWVHLIADVNTRMPELKYPQASVVAFCLLSTLQ